MRRFALIMSLAMLVAPLVASAQAPDEAPDPSVALITQGRGQGELINIWRSRDAADPERAEEQLDRLLRTAREAGITRLDPFAVALLREAQRAADAGRFDDAYARVTRAELLAPGLPEVYDVHASLVLDDTPWALHTWAKHRIKGLLARIDDFQRRMLLFSDFVLGMLMVIGVVGFLFALAQLARYAIHLFHDLGHAFPSAMRIVLLIAIALVLALPLIYGFGPVLLLFPLAVALWSYQSRAEKVLSVVFIVFLGTLPWLLRMGDRLTEAGTGPTQALHALSLNPTDARALETVEAAVEADPDDWAAQAVLGLTYKRRGRLEDAEPALRAAIKGAEGAAEGTVYNTLGNVLFARGLPRSAEEAYERASKRLRDAPEPIFNRHRLYRRLGRSDDANAAMQQATALDAPAVAAWSQDDEPYVNRYVVDLDLPTSVLTRRALEDLFSPTPLARRAWVALAGPVPEMTAPLAGLATVVLFAVLTGMRRKMRLNWPCFRCARPAPSDIADGPPAHPQCEQCVNLFVRNIHVDRQVRFRKEQTIARWSSFRRWSTRALGVTVPGLVDLVRGQAVRGVVLVSATVVFALWLVEPHGLLLEPFVDFDAGEPGLAWGRYLLVALLAGLWITNVVYAVRYKERV